jgi:hypothetical protein
LAYIGYGYFPAIVGEILISILSLVNIYFFHVPLNSMIATNRIVINLFLIYCINLWIFGTKHALQLSTKDALISTLIPCSFLIGIKLFEIVKCYTTILHLSG